MVVKRTEYQNQFKSSTLNKNQNIYQENLTFRHERRDREFIHTPINWFSQSSDELLSSDEDVKENSGISNGISKTTKPDEPEYQSLAEILDQSKAKSIAFRQTKRDDVGLKEQGLPDVLKLGSILLEDDEDLKDEGKGLEDSTIFDQIALPDKLVEDVALEKKLKSQSNLGKKSRKVDKSSQSKEKSSQSPSSQVSRTRPVSASRIRSKANQCDSNQPASNQVPVLQISSKPRRPDRQGRIPSAKARPMSSYDRPPFVAYGAGDREDTFTTHRTHNVRSTADVYAPALKAKMRREEEKKRQLARHSRLAQSASDILDKLALATPRDDIDWRSEYQKQFHGYEPREYERASSSRAVIHHSIPIRAVHRGGGLIVHVD